MDATYKALKIESLRLSLLKVKPSLRDSIFKASHVWALVMSWSCPCFCLFWVFREYLTSNKKLSHNLTQLSENILTASHNSENILTASHNSHTFSNLYHRTSTTLTEPLSTTLIERHTTLINSHTYSEAKHCSSHSHTISAVHLLILMSGKGLLTL